VGALASPLVLLWLALGAATLLFFAWRQWRAALVGLLLTAGLWLAGQPALAWWAAAPLERAYFHATLEAAPAADAVVVLGGCHRPSAADFAGLDLTAGVDRLVAGAELARRGRAPALFVGGDGPPGTPMAGVSAGVAAWWRAWGLTNFPFATLGPVTNTRDEAVATAALARERGWRRVLLVTSALHLRRAEAAFRAAGVPVAPVACDFQVVRAPGGGPAWSVLPQAEAFQTLGAALHERVGFRVYRWRGWL
jgi:uncharacterized SAM-binding protein YcdF (DUF218 family)